MATLFNNHPYISSSISKKSFYGGFVAKALHCINMCHMCINETFNSYMYMILNSVIGSIQHYYNIMFVIIVCLLCIHNVVGVKHDVSSVLYQHYNMKWWCILCILIMYHRKNSIEIWDESVPYYWLFVSPFSLCLGPLRKTLFSSLL